MIWLAFYLGGVVAMLSVLLCNKIEDKTIYLAGFIWFLAIPMAFIRLLKRGVSNG